MNNLLDSGRLLVGLPLTTPTQRRTSGERLTRTEGFNSANVTQRQQRLDANQTISDDSGLGVKGAGENFTVTPEAVTREGLLAEVRELDQTIPVLRRMRRESINASWKKYRATRHQAGQTYKSTIASAKRAHASSVAGLLKVEVETRQLADSTYSEVVSTALATLKSTRQSAYDLYCADYDAAGDLLQEQLQALGVRRAALEDEIVALPLDPKFKRIDMGFLRMRSKVNGMPLFAVFTDTRSQFRLSVQRTKPYRSGISSAKTTIKMDKGTLHLLQYYAGFEGSISPLVDKYLSQQGYSLHDQWSSIDVTCHVSASFSGLIPQPVREKIRKCRPYFDEILIVTEAPEWEVSFEDKTTRRIPVGDPLVIGRKGRVYWLIDSFDTTSAEEYVKREFTSDQKG